MRMTKTATTTSKNPGQILQHCLPGVTIQEDGSRQYCHSESISDWKNPPHHTSPTGTTSSSSSSSSYQYYSYQSLHVIKDFDVPRLDWVHHHQQQQRHLQRRQQSWHRWCVGILLLILSILACNRADSKTNTVQVIQVLQRGGGHGDNDIDDDDSRQAILHALEKLDEQLEGDIVLQSTKPKFIEAATVWRQGVMPPMAVIEAKTQQDVILAVPILAGLARQYNLEFAVRSGGYSPFASTKGVVLSLAHLKTLKWTNHSTVVMEPGVLVDDFQQQVLDQRGYASIVADAAKISLSGFVLGGGYGLLSRKHSLGMDNVIRLRVVLTNGFVRDVYQGDDLFWAILGSGGTNFGVVTEFEYMVYPSHDVKLAASVRLSLDDALEFLEKLGNVEERLDRNVAVRVHGIQRSANDTVSASVSMEKWIGNHTMQRDSAIFDGTTEITMYWMGNCNPEDPVGMTYIKKELGPMLPFKAVENLWFYYYSWSALSRAKEQPATWSSIWAAQSWNGFLYSQQNLPEVWSDIQQSFAVLFQYARHITPTIELWGGAIASIPHNWTAFPHRYGLYHVRLDLMIQKDNSTTAAEAQKLYEQEVALVSAVWPSISKHLRGVFVNYPMPSLLRNEYPVAYWGDNVARLAELKQRFDPFHVLRYDQNVPFLFNRSSLRGDV